MHRISYGCNDFFLSYQQIRFQAFSFALKCILTLQSNAQSSHTKYFKTLANIFMPMTNFHNKQVSSDDMLWQEKVLFVTYNYYYSDIYLYRNNFIENSLIVLYYLPQSYKFAIVTTCYYYQDLKVYLANIMFIFISHCTSEDI